MRGSCRNPCGDDAFSTLQARCLLAMDPRWRIQASVFLVLLAIDSPRSPAGCGVLVDLPPLECLSPESQERLARFCRSGMFVDALARKR